MDSSNELAELKRAWQALDASLQRQNDMQYALLHDRRVRRVRSRLRPLLVGQCLQMLFGVALIVLGVDVWRHYWEVPHLLASGVLMHVLGVATVAAGGTVCGLIARIDHSQPVLDLQRRLAEVRRAYVVSGLLVGLPWWIAWVPFVMALAASVAGVDAYAHAGGNWFGNWLLVSVAIGVVGLAATYAFHRWSRAPQRAGLAERLADWASGASLRRAQAELDELARYARN